MSVHYQTHHQLKQKAAVRAFSEMIKRFAEVNQSTVTYSKCMA
ncbi:hypothetical protein [Streptococcus halotolerans]|nr:hypothetical protein [Streptococcus halotolerans]